MPWLCNECNKESKRLLVQWEVSGGQKVDIIDYFCPHCPSNDLTFQGTKEEEDAYWNMEEDSSSKDSVKINESINFSGDIKIS